MNTRYILRKITRAMLTIWVLITFTFLALRLTGDPALTILGPGANPESIATLNRIWGLDRPLWAQYGIYLANIAHGDFGDSYADGRAATTVVMERLPKSLRLNLTAFVLTLLIGLPLGIYAALAHHTWADRAVMLFSTLGFALPNFFLGIVLILIFAMRLRWLPAGGSESWQHMILPLVTMVTSELAILTRYVRSSMLEVLNDAYLRTATMKGLSRRTVIWRHALPNALIPVVTILGFSIVGYIGGSVITENVFGWAGLGRLTVQAVAGRDMAVVQLLVIMVGSSMVIVNLLVDLLYGVIDPRIRVS